MPKLTTRPDGLKLDEQSGVLYAPRTRITPDPNQPRKDFPKSELKELRNSIDELRSRGGGLNKTGFDSPMTCRWDKSTFNKNGEPDKKSQLILTDGERRYRSTDDTFPLLPIILSDETDEDAHDAALRSSFQKKLLTPVEEGNALIAFMERTGKGAYLTAKHFGLSEGYVRNRTYLMQCTKDVQAMVNKDQATMSHALAFRAAGDKLPADDRKELIREVAEGMPLIELKAEINERVQANLLKEDAKAQPDSHTKERRAAASTARGVSTSHGETAGSASTSEAKAEVAALVDEITGKIVALESYSESVDEKYFSTKVLPHIERWQKTLNRLKDNGR